MVLVVDDLGIAWENMEATRKALRTVRRRAGPGRRSGRAGPDRRLVGHAAAADDRPTHSELRDRPGAVDALVAPRRRVVPRRQRLASRPEWSPARAETPALTIPIPRTSEGSTSLRESMSSSGTLATLTTTVQGIQDLPGRKAIVLISEGFVLIERRDDLDGHTLPAATLVRVRRALDRLVDRAPSNGHGDLRARPARPADGRTDGRGQREVAGIDGPLPKAGSAGSNSSSRLRTRWPTWPRKPAAWRVLNTNDLSRGLQRISDDQRGYYVIGYTPPADTFAAPGKTPRQHRIRGPRQAPWPEGANAQGVSRHLGCRTRRRPCHAGSRRFMTRRCRPLARATSRFVRRCCPDTTPVALPRCVPCSTSTHVR